jgi:hypothetical protein
MYKFIPEYVAPEAGDGEEPEVTTKNADDFEGEVVVNKSIMPI